MANRYKKIFTFLIVLTIFGSELLSAKILNIDSVDSKKISIQIAFFKKSENLKRLISNLRDLDIYINRTHSGYVVYVVNVERKDAKKFLEKIREKYKDAFITTKIVNKLIENREEKSYKLFTSANQKEPKLDKRATTLNAYTIVKTRKRLF